MFFKLKSNVRFRNYESFGFITDNRNFGYKQANNDQKHIGDKIVSQSGAAFLSALGRTPQTLDILVQKTFQQFTDIDIDIIKNDAIEFYRVLEQDGFIVSGKTIHECDEKDTKFSYKIFKLDLTSDNNSILNRPQIKKSTQDFFNESFNGKPQLTNVHIEITSTCNERCVHCYIPPANKVSSIEPALFYDILEQCNKMHVLHLTLSGGEPMLHRNFCDFLRKCKEYDFSVNILSNLTLLNDEIISEMKRNHLLGVQVSLYSMNSDIHDEITHMQGSFNKTINAILQLIENDIPLQINCPIMKQNKNCYTDVVNWAKKHNIRVGDDYVIIARHNHTTQNLDCRLSTNEVREIITTRVANDTTYLSNLEKEAKEKTNITPDDRICSVCQSSICIADNGNVYPCVGWQEYVVGNIKNTPLKEIWDNSESVQYLRSLRRQSFPKCIKCQQKEYCTICMVRNANEHPKGDPLIVNDYFCKIAKLIKEIVDGWNLKQ